MQPICKACKKPVTKYPDLFAVHEEMHWLCFHLAYEHDGDPDEACTDPSCPWRQISRLESEKADELLGVDGETSSKAGLKRAIYGDDDRLSITMTLAKLEYGHISLAEAKERIYAALTRVSAAEPH